MDKANGDDGRIRTLDPQSRNLVLYPAELRHHLKNSTTNLQAVSRVFINFSQIFYFLTNYFGFSTFDIFAAENLNSGILP